MRRIYRLIVVVIATSIGATGCNNGATSDYGVPDVGYSVDRDGQVDKDLPDATAEGYPSDTVYGIDSVDFNSGADLNNQPDEDTITDK